MFEAATLVNIGDGERAKFWSSSWLSGGRPKGIAPKIYAIAKKENISVKEALENDSRVANIDLEQGFDVEHIQQFVNL
jgi:hypothetical protein